MGEELLREIGEMVIQTIFGFMATIEVLFVVRHLCHLTFRHHEQGCLSPDTEGNLEGINALNGIAETSKHEEEENLLRILSAEKEMEERMRLAELEDEKRKQLYLEQEKERKEKEEHEEREERERLEKHQLHQKRQENEMKLMEECRLQEERKLFLEEEQRRADHERIIDEQNRSHNHKDVEEFIRKEAGIVDEVKEENRNQIHLHEEEKRQERESLQETIQDPTSRKYDVSKLVEERDYPEEGLINERSFVNAHENVAKETTLFKQEELLEKENDGQKNEQVLFTLNQEDPIDGFEKLQEQEEKINENQRVQNILESAKEKQKNVEKFLEQERQQELNCQISADEPQVAVNKKHSVNEMQPLKTPFLKESFHRQQSFDKPIPEEAVDEPECTVLYRNENCGMPPSGYPPMISEPTTLDINDGIPEEEMLEDMLDCSFGSEDDLSVESNDSQKNFGKNFSEESDDETSHLQRNKREAPDGQDDDTLSESANSYVKSVLTLDIKNTALDEKTTMVEVGVVTCVEENVYTDDNKNQGEDVATSSECNAESGEIMVITNQTGNSTEVPHQSTVTETKTSKDFSTSSSSPSSSSSNTPVSPKIIVQPPNERWRDQYGLLMEGISDFYDFTASVNPSRSRSSTPNL